MHVGRLGEDFRNDSREDVGVGGGVDVGVVKCGLYCTFLASALTMQHL